MTYRPVVFLLISLLTSVAAFSQITITGKVWSADHIPLVNATVLAVTENDSIVLQTALTDSEGAYLLTIQDTASMLLKVTAAGYQEQVQLLNEQSQTSTVNFTLSASSKALNAVTVTAQKPLLERRVDRMIFNLPSSIAVIGSNALEAIKKAPGVLVRSQENSISLVGKSTVLVLVNDLLVQLAGEDLFAYLQAIPSESIERIEVITTPPTKYDAAGSSGLLNIVLKKQKKMGMNGDVRAGYEQSGYGTLLGGANVNYRKGKLNVYGNASYTDGNKRMVERLNTDYTDQSFQINDPYKRGTRILEYSAGVDYEVHKSGILGIQYTGSKFDRLYTEDHSDIIVRSIPSGNIDSVIHTAAIGKMKNQNDLLNLNYVWSIDTGGKKLTLNANGLWYGSKRNRDYDTQSFYGWYTTPSGGLSRNKNNGNQSIRVSTVQADLELPYKWASLSLGGKLSSSQTISSNNFLYFDQNVFVEDAAISNEFHYDERIEAGYVSANKAIGKWELQAGLRGEFTQTKGYSAKLALANTNRYFSLFPTAYVQYKFTDDHILNINYSKRIERPGYRALDPYRSYSSPYSYVEGNPFLKPSAMHEVSMGYTLKSKYNFSAFYQYMPNTIGQVFFVDDVTKINYVRSENYGDFTFYGINAGASFTPFKPWELALQTSGSVQQVKAHYPGQTLDGRPLPTFYLSANNSFSINKSKTFFAQINAYFISKYLSDLLERAPQYNVDAGVKALFLDKKLVVSLNANDLFRSLKIKGTNIVTGQTLDSYFDDRNIRLMINYKFGNNKTKEKRDRATGIEDERSRT